MLIQVNTLAVVSLLLHYWWPLHACSLCSELGIWAVFNHGAFRQCYWRPLLCIYQVSRVIQW